MNLLGRQLFNQIASKIMALAVPAGGISSQLKQTLYHTPVLILGCLMQWVCSSESTESTPLGTVEIEVIFAVSEAVLLEKD